MRAPHGAAALLGLSASLIAFPALAQNAEPAADAGVDAAAADADVPAGSPADADATAPQPDEPASASKKHKKHGHGDDPEPGDDAAPQAKKKKAKKLEFAGRVIARSAFEQVDPEGAPASDGVGTSSISSARAKVSYRAHGLRAQLSVEFAGKPRVKNAYVELRLHDGPTKIDVRGGQFKMPVSAIELESQWTLPTEDRGLLHTILTNRYQITGRSVGAMLSLDHKGSWHPHVDVGMFQGRDDARSPLAVTASDRFGQDFVARVSAKPAHGIALGASAQARVGSLTIDAPPIIRRASAGELDASFEQAAGPGTLRAWIEGMVGTSWIAGRVMPCRGARSCKALFVETRAIAAYRLGGHTRRERYIEAYALAGALDPDRDTANDRVLEVSGGLTYGAWELWRVQAGVDVWRFGASAPLGIAAYASVPADTVHALVQLGAQL